MELLPLCDMYRKASLGREYKILYMEYPAWDKDIHKFGNYMDEEKLRTISINGLMRWYFEKLCAFEIDYNYYNIKNITIHNVSYSEWKYLDKIMIHFNIYDEFNIKQIDLQPEFKYSFLSKNKIQNLQYYVKPFGNYLCNFYGEDKLEKIFGKLKHYIYENEITNLYYRFLNKYDKVINVSNWYHRYKIVLEKMSIHKHPQLYEMDRLVEHLQQIVFTYIYNHCNDINNNINNNYNYNINISKYIIITDDMIKSKQLFDFL